MTPAGAQISYARGPVQIRLDRRGRRVYEKVSYPIRCGLYHEIETDQATLHFNLNDEPIRLVGTAAAAWPHPHEWLKRTVGNDWIYYSTGGYAGVFETTGEYYLPNLPYPTNNHRGGKPHAGEPVARLIDTWPRLVERARAAANGAPPEIASFFQRLAATTPKRLQQRAAALHDICGGRVTVLPPDARHVDYQVIPITVADGCLYKCGFCRVKNSIPFMERTPAEIETQISRLRSRFGADLVNYNAIFLGQHDALRADPRLILAAIDGARSGLRLDRSYLTGMNTFLFGSVPSLLETGDDFFAALDRRAGCTYINIGLESADQQTLDLLGKPVSAADVGAAFARLLDVNERYRSVEVTANFVTGDSLAGTHYAALLGLIRDMVPAPRSKGCIYLSPLEFDRPSRARLFAFYRLKRLSRLPLFMYTIQRL